MNMTPSQKNESYATDFTIPPEGLSDDERKARLEEFANYIEVQKKHFLGYQADQKMEYAQDTKCFLDCHVNNIGDPFVDGNFTVNSKRMEVAVLDYYAGLWHAKRPHHPSDPESYWGYVLTMGSTEGNLYGLWNARDYLAGRKLIVDNTDNRSNVTRYLSPLQTVENPNAYTPVAFFSQDTHYSIIKAMRVLAVSTFSEIGQKRYPGENPLDEDGDWQKTVEVPSTQGNPGPGCIDVDKLTLLVDFFASKGYPILICCNYGSTFKGAYDDVGQVQEALLPIFEKNGLINRTVEYETGKSDIRNGYWIHVDGALGSSYMPFVEMAFVKGQLPERGPDFDFRLPAVNSIVMSGHKWPGAPWPCGIFMTRVGYQLFPPDDPEYLGSPDSTFAGSRNGFSSIILWDYLAKNSYDKQIDRILECEKLTDYAENRLKTVNDFHPGLDLYIARTPLSLTVRFRKPNDRIIFKYSLSCESLVINGTPRHYAHLFAMPSVNRELIDNLVEDLKAKDAFPEDAVRMLSAERSRGWR
jgi:histidine decarboxylase